MMSGPFWKLACAMAAGVWLAPTFDVHWSIATSLLMMAWGAFTRLRQPLALWPLGFTLGLWVVAIQPQGPRLNGYVAVQGVVAAPPMGRSADVRLARWRPLGEGWTETQGRIRIRFCEAAPVMGTPVSVFGTAKPAKARALPGAPDPVFAMRRAKIQTQLVCLQQAVPPKPPPALPLDAGEHVGVLLALATGDRSGVSQEAWGLLRRTGTAHLLAISGFHIGLVAWFGYLVGRWISQLYALVNERGLSPVWALGLSVVTGWAYAIGAGLPVSAQRAAMMVTLVAMAKALHRRLPLGNLVGLALVKVLWFDPSAVATPGFQLSFMAVVGLVRVTPWISGRLGDPSGWRGWFVGGLSATLGATVGTLPVAGWWFQEIAVWSPVANIIALPWVAWLVVPCAFGAVWLPDPLGVWAVQLGNAALSGLVWMLSIFDTTPFVFALGPLGCLIGVLLCIAPARWSVMVLFLSQVSWSTPRTDLVITLLDVGHGESIVVEWPDGRVWVVDGGPPGRAVLQYLRRQQYDKLDVVAITHGHLDHAAGLWPVVKEMPIDEIWFGPSWDERIAETARRRDIPVRVESSVAQGSGSENDQSLVLPIHWGSFSALLTGDIGAAREAELPNPERPLDVLKIAHHGSKTSSSEAFLDRMRPKVALVSASGAYGLPHPEVLERYRTRNIRVLRTDTMGTIQVRIGPAGMQIWSYQPGRGWRRNQ